MNDCLAYALAYAEALPGKLLPVRAMEKRPAIAEWQKAASNDLDVLERWFADGRVNIGWQPDAGYIVLDVDMKADESGVNGFGTLAGYESKHGTLPVTLSATTPTDGKHYVFRLPAGITAKNVVGNRAGMSGLDIRTAGGQIVVQPSERPEGKYHWDSWNPLDGTRPHIAEAPAWVVQFACGTLDAKPKKSAPKAAKAGGGMVILEGSRNAALVTEAGRLRRVGYEKEAMVAALQALNDAQFIPPVPTDEVRAIAQWSCEHHNPTEGATLAEQQAGEDWQAEIEDAGSAADVLDVVRRLHLDPGLSRTEKSSLTKAAAKQVGVPVKTLLADLKDNEDASDDRPVISVRRNDFSGSVEGCIKVLPAIPTLRQRGSELVEVVADPHGSRLLPVALPRLAYLVSSIARWHYGEAGDGGPDTGILQAVMGAGSWPGVPKISGLLNQPSLDLASGEIICGQGYIPSLQREAVFILADFPLFEGTGQEAVALIRGLFAGFTFTSAKGEAVALAAILTAVIRPILPTAPGFLVNACDIGSGKSYLCELIAAFAGGGSFSRWPGRAEEQGKMLYSALLEARSVLVLDNLTHDLQSDALAQILTSQTHSERQLGVSKMPEVSTACLFLANGINIAAVSDLQRRMLTITLDAKCERPWERKFDRDVVAEVKGRLGWWRMVALKVLADFLNSGQQVELSSFGSFGEWGRVVRGAVVAAGLPDPVEGLAANIADNDDRETLSRVLYFWEEAFDDDAKTLREVVSAVATASGDDPRNGLKTCFLELAEERGEINIRKLGQWFKRNELRIVGRARLVSTGANNWGKCWAVQRV
jgi:hypothetical protein